MSNPSAVEEVKYFDFIGYGLGYLGRVRVVKLEHKRGASFVACSINALRGEASAVEYTKFDLICTGRDTEKIVLLLKPMIDAKKRVIVGFRVGDFYADKPYTLTKGPREGETVTDLKGRLLKISFAKCDGEPVDLSQFADPPAETDVPADVPAQSSERAA